MFLVIFPTIIKSIVDLVSLGWYGSLALLVLFLQSNWVFWFIAFHQPPIVLLYGEKSFGFVSYTSYTSILDLFRAVKITGGYCRYCVSNVRERGGLLTTPVASKRRVVISHDLFAFFKAFDMAELTNCIRLFFSIILLIG